MHCTCRRLFLNKTWVCCIRARHVHSAGNRNQNSHCRGRKMLTMRGCTLSFVRGAQTLFQNEIYKNIPLPSTSWRRACSVQQPHWTKVVRLLFIECTHILVELHKLFVSEKEWRCLAAKLLECVAHISLAKLLLKCVYACLSHCSTYSIASRKLS